MTPKKAERRERFTAINCAASYRQTFDQHDGGFLIDPCYQAVGRT
jgi:hypothetical protein